MARIQSTAAPHFFNLMHAESRSMGETNDCAVKAVAIACDVSYAEAHEAMKALGRKNRNGTNFYNITTKAIEGFGFTLKSWGLVERDEVIKSYPGVHSGLKNITTHHPRRFPQVWSKFHGNLLFHTKGHILAVRDGIVCDWTVNHAKRVVGVYEVHKA